MKESLKMLDQIIEKARFDDLQYKKQMIQKHEASKSVGEKWGESSLKKSGESWKKSGEI